MSEGTDLRNELDAVIIALETDELSPEQYAALSKALRGYSGRRFGESMAKLGQAFREVFAGIQDSPTVVAPVQNCLEG